jgi:stage IV sporulation protein FB
MHDEDLRPEPSGFRLGSIFGTTIHLEVSFLILVGLFVLLTMESGAPVQVALLWLPIAFISVLVHELGHAAVLGLLGFGPSQIALAGLGGHTFNPRRAKPWQDLLVSLAGPITSFLLFYVATISYANSTFAQNDAMLRVFLPFLAQINLIWGFFNLLPIIPLDGGQALRNFFRFFLADRTAVYLSAAVSVGLGALLIAWALFSRQFFIAILGAMLTVQNFRTIQVVRSIRRDPPGDGH